MSRRHSLNDVNLPPRLLTDLSIERLSKLTEDDMEFIEFLDSLKLDDLQRTQNKRQEIADTNFQKAVINAEKESDFEEKKAQLRSKVLEVIDLKNDHDKKYEELKSLTRRTDQETVLKNLQQAMRETEKSSEELADKFMAGTSDMSADKFTDEIQKQRALYWIRKVKAEKMEELLKNMRPTPAPRSPRNVRAHANPPYLAPMPPHQPNPAHSLPATSHAAPYPPDPRRPSDPGQSMPPYPQAAPRMPQPSASHPFPAAAYPYYRPPAQPYQPHPPPQPYQPRPPAQPYQPRPPAQPYPRQPPPKPGPYSSYNPNYYR